MPIVMSMNRLQVGAPVPNEFSPYVTLIVWAELTNAWKIAENNAHGITLAGGVGCCICFCLPFFLCHPCIQPQVANSMFQQELTKINNVHYGGKQVFQLRNPNMLNLNHELLQQQAPISSVPVAVPVTTERYIDVIVPDGATAGTEIKATSPDGQVILVNVPSGSEPGQIIKVKYTPRERFMDVVVPQGATAGTEIKATSPDGLQVNVKVPNGVAPGQIIKVKY